MMVESPSNALKRDYRTAEADLPSAARPQPAPAPDTGPQQPLAHPKPAAKSKSKSALPALAFSAAVLATLFWAWTQRDEQLIIPGSGIGYWIGIAGSVMMLVLMLYPVRKKYAKVSKYGRIATWFKSHMVMGILGPTLVILHSNFEFKAINSIVATCVMLTVVASGIVGRYLYTKIHKGLYGAKSEAKTLLADAEAFKQAFGDDLGGAPNTLTELKGYEASILNPDAGVIESAKLMGTLGRLTRTNRTAHIAELQGAIAARALREHWDDDAYQQHLAAAEEHLDLYNSTVRKAASLKFYDRLFGWWHVLHLPLFFFLILAAVVHIIAVHLY
jgi:putative effector of murein hydrolase LrgA (UPF0299 family)